MEERIQERDIVRLFKFKTECIIKNLRTRIASFLKMDFMISTSSEEKARSILIQRLKTIQNRDKEEDCTWNRTPEMMAKDSLSWAVEISKDCILREDQLLEGEFKLR